jgi:hypothetical protein
MFVFCHHLLIPVFNAESPMRCQSHQRVMVPSAMMLMVLTAIMIGLSSMVSSLSLSSTDIDYRSRALMAYQSLYTNFYDPSSVRDASFVDILVCFHHQ